MPEQEVEIDEKTLIKEGTILFVSRKGSIYTHLAIAGIENEEIVIYDLHPENRNHHGGNIKCVSYEEYMKFKGGRKLIGIYHTGASTERIKAVAEKCWKGKYNDYYFNCQQFINDITYNEFRSDLYSYYSVMFLAGAITGTVILGIAINSLAKLIFRKK